MPGRTVKQIDQPALFNGGKGLTIATPQSSPAPPGLAAIPEPEDLILTTLLERSSQSPAAIISAFWSAPHGTEPQSYAVQWSTDPAFPAGATSGADAKQQSIAIEGLRCTTAYYVRVAAIYRTVQSPWSTIATIISASDTTPPPAPSGLSASFSDAGTLIITWTPGYAEAYRDTELRIYNAATRTILYVLTYAATGRYEWTAAQNRNATSGSPDASVYVELRSRSWGGSFSSVVSASATKAPPAQVTGATATWDGRSGSCTFAWTPGTGAVQYALTIDSVVRFVTDNHFVYPIGQNRLDHGGTPDPSLAWAVIPIDALDQTGAAYGGTATLPPPAQTTATSGTWDPIVGSCTFIWDAVPGAVQYALGIDSALIYVTDTRLVYEAGQNRIDHTGTPNASLSWSVIPIDALGQTGPANGGTATLPPPPTPTGMDADFSGIDATFAWDSQADILGFRLTLDGVVRDVALNAHYSYAFALNIREHGGTPDPSLAWALVAVDGLGQESVTPATGTVVNPPPAGPVSVDVLGGFSQIAISVNVVRPLDFDHYHYRVDNATGYVAAFDGGSELATYEPPGEGTYTISVSVADVFGQTSGTAYSVPVAMNPLTLAQLRSNARYSDLDGSDPTLLNVLKDANTSSGGITYLAGGHWTQLERVLIDRYKPITIAADFGLNVMIATSVDGLTWSWFSGPLAADGRTLTAYGDGDEGSSAAANAYGNPFNTSAGNMRVDLPDQIEARFIRMYHDAGSDYTLYEYYPRRYIQTDDLDAEMIRGLTISGHQFVCDELSALTAALGAVSITGVCDIGVNGGVWQGSAGSFASPVTGLKLWRDATTQVGQIATYNGGVVQVQFDTTGALIAGAGAVRMDASGLITTDGTNTQVSIGSDGRLSAAAGSLLIDTDGITIAAVNNSVPFSSNRRSAYAFNSTSENNIGGLSHTLGGGGESNMWLYSRHANQTHILIRADGAAGYGATDVTLEAMDGALGVSSTLRLVQPSRFSGIDYPGQVSITNAALTTDKSITSSGGIVASGPFVAPYPAVASVVLYGAAGTAYIAAHNGSARTPLRFQGSTYTFENGGGGVVAQIDTNGYYYVGASKVVGARQAAIASPAATTAALKTALDLVRNVLIAHGLTA